MSDPAGRPVLVDAIDRRLASDGPTDATLQAVLEQVLGHFGCATGTLHSLDVATGQLRLRAQRGIPEPLLPKVVSIPLGKGMAGIAAERREPVQVCNLQADTSGVVRPGARETRMEGSIAVPMLVGTALRGVLGVAKPVAYEFTPAETALLMETASAIGRHLAG
jgi:putative methionine-R-sulfoxide reductase with GAF domain